VPCRDDYPPDYGQAERNEKLYGYAVNDFSLLVAVACMACEAAGDRLPPLAAKWWAHHQEQDRQRRADKEKHKLRQKLEREASEFLQKRLKDSGL
jgi:hypothetical protein